MHEDVKNRMMVQLENILTKGGLTPMQEEAVAAIGKMFEEVWNDARIEFGGSGPSI